MLRVSFIKYINFLTVKLKKKELKSIRYNRWDWTFGICNHNLPLIVTKFFPVFIMHPRTQNGIKYT